MEKIWVKNYQAGVPENVDTEINQIQSIPEILDKAFKKFASICSA